MCFLTESLLLYLPFFEYCPIIHVELNWREPISSSDLTPVCTGSEPQVVGLLFCSLTERWMGNSQLDVVEECQVLPHIIFGHLRVIFEVEHVYICDACMHCAVRA